MVAPCAARGNVARLMECRWFTDDYALLALARFVTTPQIAAMWRWLSILALLGLASKNALAAPAVPVPPPVASTKWTVDYADDHCEASRSFLIDGKPVLLGIKPPLDGGTTRLLVHKAFRELRIPEPTVVLDFGDGRPPYRTTMHLALAGRGLAMIIDLPPVEAARLRSAVMLKLKSASKVRGEFALAPSTALFAALDRCVADLRSRIGLISGVPR